ncbi:Hypothetical predicted protein [Pelobates cultripes]|uniref:Secreted protein n=1 Tax=Pelobates cultripes TaxID=61616 RepID=A0AAD1VW74_PELCU|nr:Hypothetical predicted protein [Pelobates cultripes]
MNTTVSALGVLLTVSATGHLARLLNNITYTNYGKIGPRNNQWMKPCKWIDFEWMTVFKEEKKKDQKKHHVINIKPKLNLMLFEC